MKTCEICHQEKPIWDFSFSMRLERYTDQCKICRHGNANKARNKLSALSPSVSGEYYRKGAKKR